MNLRVIDGGLSTSNTSAPSDATAVLAEGRRRLREAGYDQFAVREAVIGATIPTSVGYFRLQIDYVVKVLSGLNPVPEDFRNDIYWPAKP